jgi:hypothetical protein
LPDRLGFSRDLVGFGNADARARLLQELDTQVHVHRMPSGSGDFIWLGGALIPLRITSNDPQQSYYVQPHRNTKFRDASRFGFRGDLPAWPLRLHLRYAGHPRGQLRTPWPSRTVWFHGVTSSADLALVLTALDLSLLDPAALGLEPILIHGEPAIWHSSKAITLHDTVRGGRRGIAFADMLALCRSLLAQREPTPGGCARSA